MQQHRSLFRLSIQRTGHITRGDQTLPCDVLDLTEKGMLIRSDLRAAAGERLGLDFELTPTSRIHCTVIVTHASPPHLGVRVAEISPEDQKALSHFIDQLLALNVTGF